MNLLSLSWKNLWARPWTTLISLLLLVLGVSIISLLLQLNQQLDEQFRKNIRGIDLVVGAKGSPLQLVLSSVYHIDNPTGNIPLEEARALQRDPFVEKWIPLAYGDNYQGYRIVGTDWTYPSHYEARLATGRQFEADFEVVIGAAVAERVGLRVGDEFYGAHGNVAEAEVHDEHAYRVVGVLSPSETVIDQLILTNVSSVWGIHDHDAPAATAAAPEADHDHDHDEEHDHEHDEEHDHEAEEADRELTSVLIKWKNPMAMMQLPRRINQETSMQAAVTAIEINRLFDLFAVGISTLRGIALAIVVISAISVFFSLYNSLKGRVYELALMRTLGAGRRTLLLLILLEGLWLALLGGIVGLLLSHAGMALLSGMAEDSYRYELAFWKLLPEEGYLFLATLGVGLLAALLPALQAYRTEISATLREGA